MKQSVYPVYIIKQDHLVTMVTRLHFSTQVQGPSLFERSLIKMLAATQ